MATTKCFESFLLKPTPMHEGLPLLHVETVPAITMRSYFLTIFFLKKMIYLIAWRLTDVDMVFT